MCENCEDLIEALQRIAQWAEAYPMDIFHEPTADEHKRASKLLKDNGLSIGIFNASMGRHCLKGVGQIARNALSKGE